MIWCTIVRPNPVPSRSPLSCLVVKNGSKMCSRSAAAMPVPVSAISIWTHGSLEPLSRRWVRTVILPLRRELDERLDRGQWIADLMREAAGDDFQRAEPVGAAHQRLGALQVF